MCRSSRELRVLWASHNYYMYMLHMIINPCTYILATSCSVKNLLQIGPMVLYNNELLLTTIFRISPYSSVLSQFNKLSDCLSLITPKTRTVLSEQFFQLQGLPLGIPSPYQFILLNHLCLFMLYFRLPFLNLLNHNRSSLSSWEVDILDVVLVVAWFWCATSCIRHLCYTWGSLLTLLLLNNDDNNN